MDYLFGLDKTSRPPKGLVLLTTVYDNISLSVIRGILEDAKIPFLIKERGAGSSVKIIAGYSMFGTDIFVRPEDLETAGQLIAPEEDSRENADLPSDVEGDSSDGPSDDNAEGNGTESGSEEE